MNKKTLSKVAAILCLTTLFTSSLGQFASAQEKVTCNENQPHALVKLTNPEVKIKVLEFCLRRTKEKGELKELLLTPDKSTGKTFLMTILDNTNIFLHPTKLHADYIKLTLEYAKEADILDSVLTSKDKNGKTSLNYAIKEKASFETILEYAQTANKTEELLTAADNDGKTILMHTAAYDNGNQIIDLILSYAEKNNVLDTVLNATTTSEFNNCSFEHSALTFAVENNQLNNAKKLIEKGCNGIKCLAVSRNYICSTIHKPIIKSLVQYKNFDMVKLLVENNKLDDLTVMPILKIDINELSKLVKENKETEVFDMLQKWSKDVSFFYGFKLSEETLLNLSTIKS